MDQTNFMTVYQNEFQGVLRWPQLDELWQVISKSEVSWYIYAVGETPPVSSAKPEHLSTFITEIDSLLRRDHDEDYCGIVYTNSFENPTLIKIFDPNNLGSSCGSSGKITLPGWILSTVQPEDLTPAHPMPNNRRRWWHKLFPSQTPAEGNNQL